LHKHAVSVPPQFSYFCHPDWSLELEQELLQGVAVDAGDEEALEQTVWSSVAEAPTWERMHDWHVEESARMLEHSHERSPVLQFEMAVKLASSDALVHSVLQYVSLACRFARAACRPGWNVDRAAVTVR